MRYRCTARFVKSLERLDPPDRALALKAMRQFDFSPRAPHRDVHRVREGDPPDVWDLPVAEGFHLTYSLRFFEDDEDNCICVFHSVGRVEL